MTEHKDAPSDRLVAGESDEWPSTEKSDRTGERESGAPDGDWQWGDRWPPDGDWQWSDEWPPDGEFAWTEPPYDDATWIGATEPTPAHQPWYRRPGFLIGLIITALIALVVASVLLLTRATFSEQDELHLKPTIRTSSVVIPSGTSPSPAPATTSSEPTRSSPPTSEPEPTPEPQEPAPAAPTAGGAIGAQDPATPPGPRTNVTRTPMSFTPGGR